MSDEERPLEQASEETDDTVGRWVGILIMLVTLLGATLAFAQAQAGHRGGQAGPPLRGCKDPRHVSRGGRRTLQHEESRRLAAIPGPRLAAILVRP